MTKKVEKNTLSVYGIQDVADEKYPVLVHDHSMAFFESGRISRFCQLERITRIKHDNKLHMQIDRLLRDERIAGKKFSFVNCDNEAGRAFLSASGKFRFEAPINKKLTIIPEKGNCFIYGEKKDGYVINHELAHIYSCMPFFGKFRNNSLLVHYDGGASKSNFSAWHFLNGQLIPVEYHYHLKHLTSIFNTNALVFSILKGNVTNQNGIPGKLMGYAAYGKYKPELEEWFVKNDMFKDIWKNKNVFFKKAKDDLNITIHSFDQKNTFLQNIVATLHHIFERESFDKFKQLQEATGARYLYYAGGCALNIKLNTKLVKSELFKDVFISPCANDSGLAIGAGAFFQHSRGMEIENHSPYLNNWGIADYQVKFKEKDIAVLASLLVENKVIGVCNGYGEAGPRALGNRSIIALASSSELARKVSMKYKGREWYRPVAPVMIEKNAEYFTGEKMHHLSRYMLLDYKIIPGRIKEIRATRAMAGQTSHSTGNNR